LSVYEAVAGWLSLGGAAAQQEAQYIESNGFYFSQYYWQRLWETGRFAPGFRVEWILQNATQIEPDPRGYPGFFRYVYDGWEMIYNPTTGVIAHIGYI